MNDQSLHLCIFTRYVNYTQSCRQFTTSQKADVKIDVAENLVCTVCIARAYSCKQAPQLFITQISYCLTAPCLFTIVTSMQNQELNRGLHFALYWKSTYTVHSSTCLHKPFALYPIEVCVLYICSINCFKKMNLAIVVFL
jgi:hypothetical protein